MTGLWNLHEDYLLPYGTHVSYQGLLLLAPLVYPVQSEDIINIIGQFHVLQHVWVIQTPSDYIMTMGDLNCPREKL